MPDSPATPEPSDRADAPEPREDELRELERRLAGLAPSAPPPTAMRRALGAIERERRHQAGGERRAGLPPRGRRWLRVAPMAAAALVTVAGILLMDHLSRAPLGHDGEAPRSATGQRVSSPGTELDFETLVPVSAESSLRGVELSDIVVVEGQGPMRPVRLHYEVSQCWFDPGTLTSVQVIQPVEETVFLPVMTY